MVTNNRAGIIVTQKEGYKAFISKALPPNPALSIDAEMVEILSQADTALGRLSGISEVLPNPDLFVAMYVRKEAVLSSQIEGTEASLEDVLEYEAQNGNRSLPNDVAEVVNYVRAMNYGLKRLNELPLSLRLIKEIHAELLREVRGAEKTPGEFRRSQNWVGPKGCSLANARFVPPPPSEMMEELSQLEKYMHSELTYPLLIECGLMHFQLETIHPFLDGNGRIGRLLITFFLCWKGILKKPMLYLSHYFKQNRLEYYDRLMAVREKGDFESWIKFFLRGVVYVAEEAIEMSHKIIKLQASDRDRIGSLLGKSSKAALLHEKLFTKPIVFIKDVAALINITFPTASALCEKLVQVNILKELTGKRRNRMFVYRNYLDLLREE